MKGHSAVAGEAAQHKTGWWFDWPIAVFDFGLEMAPCRSCFEIGIYWQVFDTQLQQEKGHIVEDFDIRVHHTADH